MSLDVRAPLFAGGVDAEMEPPHAQDEFEMRYIQSLLSVVVTLTISIAGGRADIRPGDGLPPLPPGLVLVDEYSLGADGDCWLTWNGEQRFVLDRVARPDVLKRIWTPTSGRVRSLSGTYVGRTKLDQKIIIKDVTEENGANVAAGFRKIPQELLSQSDATYVDQATLRDAFGIPVSPVGGAVKFAPLPTGDGLPPLPPGATLDQSAQHQPVPKWEDSTPYVPESAIPAGLSDTQRLNWEHAVNGDAAGQAYVGWMHDTGTGVPQNLTKALKWYRLAADQGNTEAQHNLGCMFWKGRGTPKNEAEALKWVRRAAEQGNANAQKNLALMTGQQAALHAAALRNAGAQKSPVVQPGTEALAIGYVVIALLIGLPLLLIFCISRRRAKALVISAPPQAPQSIEPARSARIEADQSIVIQPAQQDPSAHEAPYSVAGNGLRILLRIVLCMAWSLVCLSVCVVWSADHVAAKTELRNRFVEQLGSGKEWPDTYHRESGQHTVAIKSIQGSMVAALIFGNWGLVRLTRRRRTVPQPPRQPTTVAGYDMSHAEAVREGSSALQRMKAQVATAKANTAVMQTAQKPPAPTPDTESEEEPRFKPKLGGSPAIPVEKAKRNPRVKAAAASAAVWAFGLSAGFILGPIVIGLVKGVDINRGRIAQNVVVGIIWFPILFLVHWVWGMRARKAPVSGDAVQVPQPRHSNQPPPPQSPRGAAPAGSAMSRAEALRQAQPAIDRLKARIAASQAAQTVTIPPPLPQVSDSVPLSLPAVGQAKKNATRSRPLKTIGKILPEQTPQFPFAWLVKRHKNLSAQQSGRTESENEKEIKPMNTRRAIIVGASVFLLMCVFLWPTEGRRSYGSNVTITYNRGFIFDRDDKVRFGDVVLYGVMSAAIGAIAGYMGRKKV